MPAQQRPVYTRVLSAVAACALLGITASAQPPAKAVTLPMTGIDTFHPVTTTIACGSNARPESMATLAKAGFKSVISVREDGEPEYDRTGAERAATDAGLRFVSIPFSGERPDPAAVERFLEVLASPDTAPAYIYCRTGQRAAMMWFVKRVKQDGWPVNQALVEAESLGLTRPELKAFALKLVGAAGDSPQ